MDIIIKKEEEEHEEKLYDVQVPSQSVTKQEKEEEPGERESYAYSLPHEVSTGLRKDNLSTLEDGNEAKKIRKRKRACKEDKSTQETAVGGQGTDSWYCRLCQRCFSSSWELTGHCCVGIIGRDDRDGTKLEFRCPVCGDRFLRPTAFIMHKQSHIGQFQYVCGICGRTLKTLRKLAIHRQSHMCGLLPQHQCQNCCHIFHDLEALKGHRVSQHGEEADEEEEGKEAEDQEANTVMLTSNADSLLARSPRTLQPPQCLRCFMTFRDAETAERHLRFKHPADYEQKLQGHTVFACCVCDRTFPSSRLLSAHQRTHSKWSLTSCGLDESLQERSKEKGEDKRNVENLEKQHIIDKSDSSPGGASSMPCIHCHIIFTDPRTWERHMVSKHPPSMTLNPSGTSTPGYLSLRPQRGQTRPYSCSTCGEKFIEESSLLKHNTEAHTS